MYGSLSITFVLFVWLITGQGVYSESLKNNTQPLNNQTADTNDRQLSSDIHSLLDELKDKSATDIFNRANKAFHDKEYRTAIQTYQVLNSLHPRNEYAEKSRLYIIQAYDHNSEIDSLIRAVKRFIVLYPKSESLEAVCYLKAEAFLKRGPSILKFFNDFLPILNIDFSERSDNIKLTEAAYEFRRFLNRFPNGSYRDQAEQKLNEIVGLLVKKEYKAIRLYFKKGNYLATYNRIVELLKQYPDLSSMLGKQDTDTLFDSYRKSKKKLGLTV